MVEIKTSVDFEAAHRQLGDGGKCGFLHGHNWHVDVIIDCECISKVGYVVDFKDIKNVIGEYDHKVLLFMEDPLVEELERLGQRVKALPLNPTCENLSILITSQIEQIIPCASYSVTIIVFENQLSYAVNQVKHEDSGVSI